ncbi:unnamed protein product [Ceutorhynchus assimilis]|uniref:Protein kinase domain-containing protein n=1 Tax=Ceutorhynchus assimilis TaxID=467358 RepID=A0A9N9QPF0_9CUCU|nr:unnamed protein product [Ceutorhynchus assimilis]
MTKWTVRLIQKYIAMRSSRRYSREYHNFSENARSRYRKYVITGITTGGLAAVAIGSSDDKNVVLTASGLVRLVRSMKVGLTISLDYYISMLGQSEDDPNYKSKMSQIHLRCAERLRDACLQNGGTYIKLGQGLVSLSHILPREYVSTLKVLQDKCLCRNNEELYEVFKEDFGKSPEDIFETFDCNPIAAASIAQVFEATTKQGKKVAVKVQYNDLQKRLNGDIMTINLLLKIGTWFHPKVDFTWILNDFEEALKQELDFVNEGRNGERCAKDLSHFNYIHVPRVLWEYTNTRVLVTEFIEGIKISDTAKLKKEGFSLVDINYKLFETFGYQIFQTGFVHADPHPGNVLVRKCNGQTELVILDHGLYQTTTKEERMALSHFWKAIVLANHDNMKTYSKSLGVDDYIMLAEVITQSPLRSTNFKLKQKLNKDEEDYMAKVAGERFDMIVNCLQQMPRSLLLIVRNLNTIRAISYDHGCPIDRYAVLARMATKASFQTHGKGILKKALVYPQKVWFETNLFIIRIVTFWRMLILDVLHKMGLAPDVRAIMKEVAYEFQ